MTPQKASARGRNWVCNDHNKLNFTITHSTFVDTMKLCSKEVCKYIKLIVVVTKSHNFLPLFSVWTLTPTPLCLHRHGICSTPLALTDWPSVFINIFFFFQGSFPQALPKRSIKKISLELRIFGFLTSELPHCFYLPVSHCHIDTFIQSESGSSPHFLHLKPSANPQIQPSHSQVQDTIKAF